MSPADELGFLREQIRDARLREKQLVLELLEDPKLRRGAHYLATVAMTEQVRIDVAALRRIYPEVADELARTARFPVVRTVVLEDQARKHKPAQKQLAAVLRAQKLAAVRKAKPKAPVQPPMDLAAIDAFLAEDDT